MIFLRETKTKTAAIDLAAIRDTLLYIESDLAEAAGYENIVKPVRDALAQIESLESSSGTIEPLAQNAVRFLPANFA